MKNSILIVDNEKESYLGGNARGCVLILETKSMNYNKTFLFTTIAQHGVICNIGFLSTRIARRKGHVLEKGRFNAENGL